MTINADTLLDRLHLKSQVTKWRVLAILFAVIALLVTVEHHTAYSPAGQPFIARLTLEGFIEDNQKVYDLINEIAHNPQAKATIVWLNTPGGSAVGGEELYVRLRQLSEKKPVVAVMRSISASAGYMIALGTDYIIAREGTITGSIGALIETAEVTEMADKLGITPIIIKSAPFKGTPNPLEKTTPEANQTVQDAINDFYFRFVDMVAERRNLPRNKVLSLADGRIYSGKSALENKLIDALGGEEEAVEWLVTQKNVREDLQIRDMEIKPDMDWLTRLAQSFSGYFLHKSRVTLDGVRAIWHPAL